MTERHTAETTVDLATAAGRRAGGHPAPSRAPAGTGPAPAHPGTGPRWVRLSLPLATLWSAAYLGLGLAWLAGAPGVPAYADSDDARKISLLPSGGPRTCAAIPAAAGATGLLIAVAMRLTRPGPGAWRRLPSAAAAVLGLVLTLLLPDFRLLATV